MNPKKLIPALCAPLVFAAMGYAPAHAQKDTKTVKAVSVKDLPSAESVLDKYVEVTGGKAAYEKINSTSIKATMTIAAQGISGTVESLAKAPNKIYVAQNFAAIGKAEQAYDGQTAWSKDPLSGSRTLSGPELAQFQTEAIFNSPLKWRELYSKTEMLGVKSVDKKPAYAIQLTNKATKKTRTEYYDTKTGLQVKSESVQESPQGVFPVETYYMDYRAVDGVKVPFKVRAVIAGQTELLSTTTEYKNNVPIDDARFTKPADAPAPKPVEPVAPQKPGEAPAAPEAPTPTAR